LFSYIILIFRIFLTTVITHEPPNPIFCKYFLACFTAFAWRHFGDQKKTQLI